MTSLTEYSQSTEAAPLRSLNNYTKTLFVMALFTSTLMMRKSAPTSQPGSRRRPLMTIWTLMAVSLHARLQSMGVKLALANNTLSNASEMEP